MGLENRNRMKNIPYKEDKRPGDLAFSVGSVHHSEPVIQDKGSFKFTH